MWGRRDVFRSLVTAAIGAAGMIVLTISIDPTVFRSPKPQTFVASFVAGGLVGFAFDLAFKLMAALHDAVDSLNDVNKTLEIERKPFNLLQRARRHEAILLELLTHSMGDQRIAKVGRRDYLKYLEKALKRSRKFQGIHKRPIRSFFVNDNATSYGEYMNLLRSEKIERTRLFIVDEDEMKEDLENPQLLARYWTETGDVTSYWVDATRFRDEYPEFNDIIPDAFALFDGALLIKYKEEWRTLEFDVVNETAPERIIFDRCMGDTPGALFHEIPRQSGVAMMSSTAT